MIFMLGYKWAFDSEEIRQCDYKHTACDLKAETSIRYVKCVYNEWAWTWRWFVGKKQFDCFWTEYVPFAAGDCYLTCAIFPSPLCMKSSKWKWKSASSEYVCQFEPATEDTVHSTQSMSTFECTAISYLVIAEQAFAYNKPTIWVPLFALLFFFFFSLSFYLFSYLRPFLCQIESISPTKHTSISFLPTRNAQRPYWCQHNRNEK